MSSYYSNEFRKSYKDFRKWAKKHTLFIDILIAFSVAIPIGSAIVFFIFIRTMTNDRNYSTAPSIPKSSDKASNPVSPYDDPSQFTASRFADVIGGFRIEEGIHALVEVPELDAAARNHAYDMQVNNYNSSTSPDGITDSQRISDAIEGATYTGSYWDTLCSNATVTSEDSKLFESKYESMLVDPRYDYYGVGMVSNTSATGKCNGYLVVYFASVH